jgi:putative copper resistance protein D
VEEILINPLIVVRDIHYATSVIVAGIVFFDLFIAAPVLQMNLRLPATESFFRERTARILWISLAISIASALAWLCLVSARIAAKPVETVIADGTVWTVLLQTQFGLSWGMRILLGILLGACLLLQPKKGGSAWQRILAALLAGGYMGALAFAGHGEEGLGFERDFHLAADFLHLLAAGLWLGGLIPLALLLTYLQRFREEQWVTAACHAASRFSSLGILAVAILLITGTINVSFLVGGISSLTDTSYGRLLLLKIALFLAMFSMAAVNRHYLLPRLCAKAGIDQDLLTTERLVRSTLVETALGLGIIMIVGVLGIMAPAIGMSAHIH